MLRAARGWRSSGNREAEQRPEDDFGALLDRLLGGSLRALRAAAVVLDQQLDVRILKFDQRELGGVAHRLRGNAGIACARQRQQQADADRAGPTAVGSCGGRPSGGRRSPGPADRWRDWRSSIARPRSRRPAQQGSAPGPRGVWPRYAGVTNSTDQPSRLFRWTRHLGAEGAGLFPVMLEQDPLDINSGILSSNG